MKLKVGVFGSSVVENNDSLVEIAEEIGSYIAREGHIIITGACDGLPYKAVKAAKSLNGYSIGYSPVSHKSKHEELVGTSLDYYDELVVVPENYEYKDDIYVCRKYRNVSSVANCDVAIFISGRWGTLNEFAISCDTGKVIGVINGAGKFSSCVEDLLAFFQKSIHAQIVYNNNPRALCSEVFKAAILKKTNK